jgi:hypothetical protein
MMDKEQNGNHNVNENSINSNILTENRRSIKNAGREILSSLSKSSKTTPVYNKKVSSPIQNHSNFSKNSLLIRDRINNTPGYGLWCTNIKEIPKQNFKYDELQMSDLITSGIKNFSENEFKNDIEQKTIEALKIQVSQLISKLENVVGNFHDANVKALRAEELKDSYHQIAEERIRECKEMTEIAENLQKENLNLKEALNNSTKEIGRLNQEFKLEREKNIKLSESFNYYAEEKEACLLNLTNQVNLLEEKMESMTIERNNFIRRNSKNFTENDADLIKNKLKEESKEVSRSYTPKNDYNELVLKYQLDIVDLKNKIIDEENQRNKLMDVLKSKKLKIKSLKNEIDKISNVFGEYSKDMKWNQDLINKKQSMIKLLKDELNIKDEKEKNLLKEIHKLKNSKPLMNEVGVQKDDDIVKVNAQPKFFK